MAVIIVSLAEAAMLSSTAFKKHYLSMVDCIGIGGMVLVLAWY